MKHRLFTILSAVSLLLFLAVVVMWVRSAAHPIESRTTEGLAWLTAPEELETRPQFYEMWQWAYFATSHTARLQLGVARVGYAGRTGWTWNPRRVIRNAGEGHGNVGDWMAVGPGWLRRFPGVSIYRSEERDGIGLEVHYGLIACATLCLPLVWIGRWGRARRRASRALCPTCGYDLRASPDRCPECGTAAAHARA